LPEVTLRDDRVPNDASVGRVRFVGARKWCRIVRPTALRELAHGYLSPPDAHFSHVKDVSVSTTSVAELLIGVQEGADALHVVPAPRRAALTDWVQSTRPGPRVEPPVKQAQFGLNRIQARQSRERHEADGRVGWSIPPREQRHVDRSILGEDPSLEYNAVFSLLAVATLL
jgi:hypothetical protein